MGDDEVSADISALQGNKDNLPAPLLMVDGLSDTTDQVGHVSAGKLYAPQARGSTSDEAADIFTSEVFRFIVVTICSRSTGCTTRLT